jgi:hypothetical protein
MSVPQEVVIKGASSLLSAIKDANLTAAQYRSLGTMNDEDNWSLDLKELCIQLQEIDGWTSEARAAREKWLNMAFGAVTARYPDIDWGRESEEINQAEHKLWLAFVLHFKTGRVPIDKVRDAWRVYYKLHL